MSARPPGAGDGPAPKRRRLAQLSAERPDEIARHAQESAGNVELTVSAPSTRDHIERVTEAWNAFSNAIGLRYETKLSFHLLLSTS